MLIENNTQAPLANLIRHWQTQTGKSTYFGVQAVKNPGDAWVYQEIITAMEPDVIVEIGVKHGGGALYLAHLCDLMGKGRVIGVDISMHLLHSRALNHPRTTFVKGDAVRSFPTVKSLIKPGERVLVIEDSAHTYDVTLGVMELYGELIQVGDYMIIEDSINYDGVFPNQDFGVAKAITEFTRRGTFVSDRSMEPYCITWNPKGFLKRIK